MSVRINCKSKEILHIKNSILRCIYFNIRSYLEQSKMMLSPSIKRFIEEDLYLATEGQDFDIIDFVKTKDDMLHFADLIRIAIEKEQSSETPFTDEVEKILIKFYEEIITCSNLE